MISNYIEIYDVLKKYYVPIQDKYSFISLGGSIPLIISNLIPFRPIKDIDIISTQFVSKAEIKHEIFGCSVYELPSEHPFSMGDYRSYCHKPFTDIGLDIFINPQATYYYVKYKDLKLRISPPEEIIQFKFKGHSSGDTTINDMNELLKTIKY